MKAVLSSCGCDSLNKGFFPCPLLAKVETIGGQKLELLNWDTCLKKL